MEKKFLIFVPSEKAYIDGETSEFGKGSVFEWQPIRNRAWQMYQSEATRRLERVKRQYPDAALVPAK